MTVIHWKNPKTFLTPEQQKAACEQCDQKVGQLERQN